MAVIYTNRAGVAYCLIRVKAWSRHLPIYCHAFSLIFASMDYKTVWHAIYTRPRSEKKTAERLELSGFQVYCPTRKVVRQWSDRKKKVEIPVLPSYVFVRCRESDRIAILQTPGVRNFVFWLGKPALVRQEEIERMQYVLDETNANDQVHIEAFQPGQKARILKQGFAEESGVIQRVGRKEITILLEGIGILLTVSKVYAEGVR